MLMFLIFLIPVLYFVSCWIYEHYFFKTVFITDQELLDVYFELERQKAKQLSRVRVPKGGFQ